MTRSLDCRLMGKYLLVFVTSGLVSTLGFLAAHIIPHESSKAWICAFAVTAPFLFAIPLRAYRKASTGENLGKVIFAEIPAQILLLVLFVLSMPTPVQFFSSWAIAFCTVAAFLMNIISGGLLEFLRLRKLMLAISVTWIAAVVIDAVARWISDPFWVKLPNGVSLGYNLFFLFHAVAIISLLSVYPIQPLPKVRSLWMLSISGGCLLGYIISVPILKVLLQYTSDLNGQMNFVLAQSVREILIIFGGCVFAAIGEKKKISS